ncbi:MAG: branched-chain amino acid ABC transporter permease [Deltaproteobacteria bacterium]|nr:branched-chain amino acid ABC transporter permease [Deltaproteobacteria bacterium]MBW1736338.1 branched-chain amino acid ABC transporter permease [Deltaproteobacteria bacterium]MBW1909070.1 branched-chain amino acid ABC transporter permease [Deltaproteobacteria bacterium]MBW2032500.1 branched-chain amino acid ABC transporter permease [Deltaproteobacteria bacterium]MBW2113426.1 branched-chain amino acid ABC transporter permease [Deltaproteobacteria bacterium]
MGILGFYLRKLFNIVKREMLVLPSRIVVGLFFLVLLLLPVVTQDPYVLRILVLTSIFAILAASWDLLSGFTGQMNFGHALFFGVGAYTAALLNLHAHIPPWGSIPLGGLGAVLAGLIIGIPCLRLRGTYLALTTLAFPIILMGIVFAFSNITGGELGVSGLSRLSGSRLSDYYITVVVMLGLCTIMWKITDSNTGIIFHAIREDEVAVRAAGINTTRYKLLAFCLSGFFAGISGGLYAHFMRIAGPSTLEVSMSFTVVIWAIFGGIVTIYGPVGAVFILFPLLEFFRFWPEYRMLMFAVIVLLTLLYMPDGLFPWLRDKVETECPRCKIRNVATRKTCRVCTAPLD